jgi:hypothetical protein
MIGTRPGLQHPNAVKIDRCHPEAQVRHVQWTVILMILILRCFQGYWMSKVV